MASIATSTLLLALACAQQTVPRATESASNVKATASQWVAEQLTAELALDSPKATPVDPSTVNVYRTDTIAGAVSVMRITVMGITPEREYSVMQVHNKLFRLAGFRDSELGLAWAAVLESLGGACEETEHALLRGVAPHGGVGFLVREGPTWPAPSEVIHAYQSQPPPPWPTDTVIQYGDTLRLRVVTALSQHRVAYPGLQAWSPIAYAMLIAEKCRLVGWDMRMGPAFGVMDSLRGQGVE